MKKLCREQAASYHQHGHPSYWMFFRVWNTGEEKNHLENTNKRARGISGGKRAKRRKTGRIFFTFRFSWMCPSFPLVLHVRFSRDGWVLFGFHLEGCFVFFVSMSTFPSCFSPCRHICTKSIQCSVGTRNRFFMGFVSARLSLFFSANRRHEEFLWKCFVMFMFRHDGPFIVVMCTLVWLKIQTHPNWLTFIHRYFRRIRTHCIQGLLWCYAAILSDLQCTVQLFLALRYRLDQTTTFMADPFFTHVFRRLIFHVSFSFFLILIPITDYVLYITVTLIKTVTSRFFVVVADWRILLLFR